MTNLVTGVLSQAVILVLNFVIRYLFVWEVGYEYLGINSLFSNILTVLSVADLGFGSALGIVLYSSLAKHNEEEIAGLMNFFKKVYFVMGCIVTVAGLAVTPFVGYLVNTKEEIPYLSVYFLFFLANTVASYFISYRTILIRADQKNSVVNNVTTIVKIAKAVLEAAVLIIGPRLWGLTVTYMLYLGVMVLATYAIGAITAVYAKRHYRYAFDNKVRVSDEKRGEIISTTKDLLIYRLCNAFSTPIDSILISLFVGTALLGVHSNYLLIVTTLIEFICLISRNVISSVGNFVVERPLEDQKKLYFEMQMIYFAIILFATINFVGLASPFLRVVFKEGSTLSNWVVFLFGGTIVCKCAGELAIVFRETTKIYKRTKYISLFYTALHIGLSVLFGYFWGLEGVMLGSVVSYFATNFWFEIFALFRWYFKTNPLRVFLEFLYVLALTVGLSAANYYLCDFVANSGNLLSFLLAGFCSLALSLASLLALFPIEGFKSLLERVKTVAVTVYQKIRFFYESRIIQFIVVLLYVVALTALLVARDVYLVDIDKFVFFGVLLLAVLLCNRSNALLVLLFTLPIAPNLAELYILGLTLVYMALWSLPRHSLSEWITIFIVPVILFILEVVLSFIYGSVEWNLALRIFVLLSILAIIFYDRHLFQRKHLFAFVLGCAFFLTFVAVNWIVPAVYGLTHKGPKSWLALEYLIRECRLGDSTARWIAVQASVDNPYATRDLVSENTNNIGYISIVSLSCLYAMFGTLKLRQKLGALLLMALFLFYGIWSQSRTFIIVFAMFVLIAIPVPLIAKRAGLWKTLFACSVLAAVVLILIFTQRELLEKVLARFQDESVYTGGGRLGLIAEYMKFVFSDWKYALFGVSCSNILPVTQVAEVPHTNFVQFIVAYGVLVFAAFLVFVVISFIRTKRVKIRSAELYLLMPLLFATIFTLTLQLFLPSIVLIAFVPPMICLSFLNKGIDEEKRIHYNVLAPEKQPSGSTIRLAMCSTSFGGGIRSYIANVIPTMLERGFDVSLVFNPSTKESEFQSFQQYQEHSFTYDQTKKTGKLLGLIKKYRFYKTSFESIQPSVIYINFSSFVRIFVLMMAARNYKKAFIVLHSHTSERLSFGERLARFLLSFKPYHRYACSSESGASFYGKGFLKRQSDAVITNFIDAKRFRFDSNKRQSIRKVFGVEPTTRLLGSVGQLSEMKNHAFLIDLLKRLPVDYKLLLLGDGPLRATLESQVASNGLAERVLFAGERSDAEAFYCAFDYFCLPSFFEGLPFAGVEAQCSGVQCLLSDAVSMETQIARNVAFLPLDLKAWERYILEHEPVPESARDEGFAMVEQSSFSAATMAEALPSRIGEFVYE